jgi:hypothetical protein
MSETQTLYVQFRTEDVRNIDNIERPVQLFHTANGLKNYSIWSITLCVHFLTCIFNNQKWSSEHVWTLQRYFILGSH